MPSGGSRRTFTSRPVWRSHWGRPSPPKSSAYSAGETRVPEAIGAAVEIIGEHERTKDEAKARKRAARGTPEYQATLVHLLQVENDPQGRSLIWLQFQNGARYDVQAIGVTIHYVGANQALYQDPSCGGPVELQAGETKWFACQLYSVQGATNYQVQVTGIEFR